MYRFMLRIQRLHFIAPEDAAQRTVYFETELQPNQEFMVEYSFDYHINYVELDPKRVAGEQPGFLS